MHVQPLEPRRLFASQRLVDFDYRDVTYAVPGDDDAIYGVARHNADDSRSGDGRGVARFDGKTGKTRFLDVPGDDRATSVAFVALGRPFVRLADEFGAATGFGVADFAARRVSTIDAAANFGTGEDVLPAEASEHLVGGGRVYFFTEAKSFDKFAVDPAPRYWVSDGTAKGTRALGGVTDAVDPTFVAFAGGRAYFTASTAGGVRRLWSVGAGDARPTLAFDPRTRDASRKGRLENVAPFGDGVLVALRRPDRKLDLLRVDADGVRTVRLAGPAFDGEPTLATYASPDFGGVGGDGVGNAAGAFFITGGTDAVGASLWFVDADTATASRVVGVAIDGYLNVSAVVGDAYHRFAVSTSTPKVEQLSSKEPFVPVAPQADAASLFAPADRSLRQYADQPSGTPVATREGVFAVLDDASVWRVDAKRAFPVAYGGSEIAAAGGRLAIRSSDASFRQLRDAGPIAWGSAFRDDDGDRAPDAGEVFVDDGRKAFLDLDRDGKLDKSEPASPTSEFNGRFYIDGVAAGTYPLSIERKSWSPSPGASWTAQVSVGPGATPRAVRFALKPPTATLYVLPFYDKDGDGLIDRKEGGVDAEAFIDDDRDGRPDAGYDQFYPVDTFNGNQTPGRDYAELTGVAIGRHLLRVRRFLPDGKVTLTTIKITVGGGVTRIIVAV